jgi:hypothetical protein
MKMKKLPLQLKVFWIMVANVIEEVLALPLYQEKNEWTLNLKKA